MRVLVLGGTVFLGRHVVETALARGDEVTIFTRGHNEAPAGVISLIGDRDGGLDALRSGSWDVVVDTSGYVPRVVRQSADLLRGRVGFYAFVSTISVYPMEHEDKSETAPVAELEDPATEDIDARYGALKAACERVLAEIYGPRVLQARSGLIAGPFDTTERVTYWAARGLRPGEVLAAGRPEREVCFIDARDLAAWMLDMAARSEGGVYNVQGPDVAMGHLRDPGRDLGARPVPPRPRRGPLDGPSAVDSGRDGLALRAARAGAGCRPGLPAGVAYDPRPPGMGAHPPDSSGPPGVRRSPAPTGRHAARAGVRAAGRLAPGGGVKRPNAVVLGP
jgi:nucleoside-diphosphate-sugar epimerase